MLVEKPKALKLGIQVKATISIWSIGNINIPVYDEQHCLRWLFSSNQLSWFVLDL